jgi:hypothetical protein
MDILEEGGSGIGLMIVMTDLNPPRIKRVALFALTSWISATTASAVVINGCDPSLASYGIDRAEHGPKHAVAANGASPTGRWRNRLLRRRKHEIADAPTITSDGPDNGEPQLRAIMTGLAFAGALDP